MLGRGPYQCGRCPRCGELMWNGYCENIDCEYHWIPVEEEEEEEEEK